MGKATHLASNDAHQVIARAVPLSLIRIISFWKFVGVPERLVVMEVIAVARAVMECASELSVFIVGVADEVSEVTRGVIRLLVRVAVAEFFVLSLVLSTLFKAKSVFNCNIVRLVHTHAFLCMISSLLGVRAAMAVRSLSSGCLLLKSLVRFVISD